MRVAILHHDVSAADCTADQDVLVQAGVVEEACRKLGHQTVRWACPETPKSLPGFLADYKPDVVFQLVERVYGSDKYASEVTSILAELNLPFTGSGSAALDLSNDKVLAKQVLQAAGLPTPRWVNMRERGAWLLAAKELPSFILKPLGEHSSVGMDDTSVWSGTSAAELFQEIGRRSPPGKPHFAEEFIDGREFNLSLLAGPSGPQVLPPAEIDFSAFPAGKPKIVNYAAKWDEKTFEFQNTPRRFDFLPSDQPLLAELSRLSIRCWEVFGLKGYVRVDFRVDDRGQPWILEINTNPCLSPDAGYAAALRQAGIPIEEAVRRILEDAFRGSCGGRPDRQLPLGNRQKPPGGPPAATLRFEPRDSDRQAIRRIVDSTGLFRQPEVDVAVELVEARLTKGAASGYEFAFAEENGDVLGYACFGHNSMTVASYDLYWICVDKSLHGRGVGRQLLEAVEQQVHRLGGQRIYIETSTRPDYVATRGFYLRCGYALEAELHDYYAPGDGKAIFVKAI
jgi:D-alanine-D-alanine ligase-like ATP-grasp enzyme/GNAT superfamily N-acetyltransferase